MATPRTKPAAQRRADLLAAAQQIFLDKGVAATTIEDITTVAGVAKGTFYLYFGSKEDVRAALQHEMVSGLVAENHKAMARHDPDDWSGRLDTWVAATIHAYDVADRRLHEVLFSHVPVSTPVRTGIGAEPNLEADSLIELLERGAKAGAFELDDPQATGVLLYAALHGAAHLALHHPDEATTRQLTTAAQLLARRAVGSRPPPPAPASTPTDP